MDPADRRSTVVVLVAWSIGLVVLAAGIAAVLAADLGAGPLDVVTTAVARLTGWPIGIPIMAVNAALALAAWRLSGQLGAATVVTALLLGPLIDLWLVVLDSGPHVESVAWAWGLLVVGVLLIGLGGAIQIASGWGPSPLDAFCVAVAERRWSLRAVRTATEVSFAVVGGLAGGALAIGTLVVALGVGPALAGWLRLVRRGPLAHSERTRPHPGPRRH
jgi:uncharacterized membrane protein YczE